MKRESQKSTQTTKQKKIRDRGSQRVPARKNRKNKIAENTISFRIGLVLVLIELISSIVFVVSLLFLNMLPVKYLAVLSGVLWIVFLLLLLSELKAKKYAIIMLCNFIKTFS